MKNNQSTTATNTAPEAEIRYSARAVAELMGEDFAPTSEQEEVIEADLQPRLVLAGAGSGKTKTLSQRVAWLVANGVCRPEHILGLTFTRKAAGELSQRINAGLRRLHQQNAEPHAQALADATIGTYHSYAQGLVREHGMLLGVEPDAELITDARATLIIEEIVDDHLEEYSHATIGAGTLVNAALKLCSQMAEHLVNTAAVHAEYEKLLALFTEGLSYDTAEKAKLAQRFEDQLLVAQLAAQYTCYKRENHLMDYGDLIAYAAELATIDQVRTLQRQRYKVVLLDEFQDTSYAQLTLFHRLFGQGHSITAVGDANQAIYGFRGASTGQLASFRELFHQHDGAPAALSYLTRAFRNSQAVLEVANKLIFPTVEGTETSQKVPVKRLAAAENAAAGQVRMGYYLSEEDEANAIAAELAHHREQFYRSQGKMPSSAVLIRTNRQAEAIIRALKAARLPYRQLSAAGLLLTPEVVDIRCVLTLLDEPLANASLVRILTGAKYQLSPADVMRFSSWVSQRQRRSIEAATTTAETGLEVAEDAPISLFAGLLELRELAPKMQQPPAAISAAGFRRLLDCAQLMHHLQQSPQHDLAKLIRHIEAALGIDVELVANPTRELSRARSAVEQFISYAKDYQNSSGSSQLRGFLHWMQAALTTERALSQAVEDAEPDAIHILTMHAAKGLEWDHVVVAGMNQNGLCSQPPARETSPWYSSLGELPWPLRGDCDQLPHCDFSPDPDCSSWAKWKKAYLDRFKSELIDYAGEEARRLAYVAVTRARTLLLLTGHYFTPEAKTPRRPSFFLEEISELSQVQPMEGALDLVYSQEELKTLTSPHEGQHWLRWFPADPFDPVEPLQIQDDPATGSYRLPPYQPAATPTTDRLRAAAAEVTAAQAALVAGNRLAESAWEETILGRSARFVVDRLTAQARSVGEVTVPDSLSTSEAVRFSADPQSMLKQWARPMPQPASWAQRRGNEFHQWVEEYYGAQTLIDQQVLIEHHRTTDSGHTLATMKENFLASRYAQLNPVAIEESLRLNLGGRSIPGRLDAAFATDDGGVELVDWKTGAVPSGQELIHNALQLGIYRIIWANRYQLPLEKIRCTFFYVAHNTIKDVTELVAEHYPDEHSIEALLNSTGQQQD